jgi:hypothetical protein
MNWLGSVSEDFFGTFAYAAVALAAWWILVRPSVAAVSDSFAPRDEARRMAAAIFWLVLLLPIATSAVTRTNLLSIWSTEALGLLPVLLLSSPRTVVSRIAATRIAGFAVIVSILALLASPIVAAAKLYSGVENNAAQVAGAVAAVEREWRAVTDRRLQILAGPFTLVSSMAFTMKDEPSTFDNFSPYLYPWADAQALAHKGMAVICPIPHPYCLQGLDILTKQRPVARRIEIDITPRWLGLAGEPAHFVIAIMPPQ